VHHSRAIRPRIGMLPAVKYVGGPPFQSDLALVIVCSSTLPHVFSGGSGARRWHRNENMQNVVERGAALPTALGPDIVMYVPDMTKQVATIRKG